MLDINFIRNNEEQVKKAIIDKGEKDTEVVSLLLQVDEEWRQATHKADVLRGDSNAKAKEIGRLMGSGAKEEAQAIIRENSAIKEDIKTLENRLNELNTKRNELLLKIPNVPHPSVPVGATENDNQVFKTWGEPDQSEWRKPHWELIERYGWVDFERGVKVAGAGFPF